MALLINKEGATAMWPPLGLLSTVNSLEQLHNELLSPGRGHLWQSKYMFSWRTQGCLEKDSSSCCSKALMQGQLGFHSAQGLGLSPSLGLRFWEGLANAPVPAHGGPH